ncbi:FecR family protein [Pontibacterium granulatum]|uniref:FecR family protein n=1 Tax=Pontibacterium granulatum TaxID=2036029 RepID=UPI00249BFE24|nr:FecR family protein [Pontibacterium granulatum]MDI3325464.1 FecR family protein [Pontibacterium granulatum]
MWRLMVLILALSASFNSFAMEAVGQVILSYGDNLAVNAKGITRALKRGAYVYEKDRLETGVRGRLHIRFADGSRMNMKPESALQLAQFEFKQRKPEQGKAVFQLLRGGLRTITGKIGKTNPDNYKFQTVLATIGIRGTVYEVYMCDRCCAETHNVSEGVAGGVERGGIDVDTAVGKAEVDPGAFFELTRESSALMVSNTRPAMLAIDDVGPYIAPQHRTQLQPRSSEQIPVDADAKACSERSELGALNADMAKIWSLCGDQGATGGS